APEFFEPLINLLTRKLTEPVDTELLTAEATHYRAINHGAIQVLGVDMPVTQIETAFRQVSDKSTGETIARARGVKYFLQQVPRRNEQRIASEQHGPVLAAFNDECVRAHVQNLLRCLPEVILSGKHSGFTIVDQQEVPIPYGLQQLLPVALNPEIHRIAAGESQMLHLSINIFL